MLTMVLLIQILQLKNQLCNRVSQFHFNQGRNLKLHILAKTIKKSYEQKLIPIFKKDTSLKHWSGIEYSSPITINKRSLFKSRNSFRNKKKYWYWFYKKRK